MDIDAKDIAIEAIQNTASTVDMTQSKWTYERVHQGITNEVKTTHGATGRAGKYRVNLANGFERDLQAMTRIMSRAYHTHLRMTMPWGEGQRLLPNTQLVPYLGAMQEYKDDLDKAKAELLPRLPQCIAKAIAANNGLCSTADYPSPQELIDSYRFTFDFTPLPDAGGFAGLPEGFETVFTDRYNQRVRDMLAGGIEDGCQRLLKLVIEFNAVLGKDKPKFFQSTIDNMRQLTATLRASASIADDADLMALCDVSELVSQYDADQLRNNMNARVAAQASCEACITTLHAVLNLQDEEEPAHSEPPATNELDVLLGPAEETPSDLATEIADSMNVESRTEAEELLGDIMPELSVSTVETETDEPVSQTPRDMIAEVANMDVDDDIEDDLKSLFDGL